MKTYCKDYLSKSHSKIDLSEDISCCLFLLIEKYNESNNNSSRKEFSNFLLHSLNYYLKDKNFKINEFSDLFLNNEEISLSLFSKFLDILIHYSAIFIFLKKAEYAKFILSLGVDLINKSDFKFEKIIMKRKISLANNISCVYILNNNLTKAELFLERCKDKTSSSLNKLIIYNNSCIIMLKKLKYYYNNENENIKIVENILQYLNMIFNDINKRRENKFKSYSKFNNNITEEKKVKISHKNELFCFLIYNCYKMMKIFNKKEFDTNFPDVLYFIQNLIGKHHFIALNMKRLEDKNDNSEYLKLLLNENFNDLDTNSANKDIISYIKKDGDKKEEEKNILEIEKGINFEIKNAILKIDKNEDNNEDKKENNIINEKNINSENPQINKEEIKKEDNEKTNQDSDINTKTKLVEETKKNPKSIGQKKTWKGLFQIITGKKFQGQENKNKFSELFKSITKSKNESLKKLENIKSQYNEYHEEMESYLKDKIPENFITFNKSYSNSCSKELIICVIDENDEEKNKFDKIAFEKSLQRETQIKRNSNFIINYFKNSIRKQIIFPDLISDILEYDLLEKMNNLYSSKKKNELSINKEIERIINNSSNNKIKLTDVKNNQLNPDNVDEKSVDKNKEMMNCKIETEFYLDTDKYKITYINDIENRKILIQASKSKSNQAKKESIEDTTQFVEIKSQISYDDINYYYSKYYSKKKYEFCIYLRYMKDINYFIQRILVHYIRLIKIEDKPKLVFCKYPKGNFKRINRKGRPEFTFLNEKCTFELCKYSKNLELNIYNLTYTSNLKIILILDYSSESVFFQEKTKKSKNNLKISADFEHNSNYKIFSRFGNFFIKLEKICQFRDKNIKTFSEYAKKYKSNIHKFSSTDSMINMDLWIISLQEVEPKEEINENKYNDIFEIIKSKPKTIQFQWNVEFYSLTKLAIKNGSFYMYKNIILTPLDFENILGCDYSDIYTIIDDRDNFHCQYFLLSTLQKMKHILIKMLNSGNYLTAFRLQKINPISFFKYKFVFKHIKRYFICSSEFLIYTRESFFLRIMVSESITNRSYSKIFIPIHSIKFEFDINEMEKFLKKKYDAITTLYQNKQKLKKFLLEESQNLLTKKTSIGPDALILFENIEFLVDRIKIFLAENPN